MGDIFYRFNTFCGVQGENAGELMYLCKDYASKNSDF